jgi:tetratricopeptide (TPR) repeat protein
MASFDQAIKKDSVYALAYVGLADCYNILGLYTYLPPKEAFPQAKALAQRAMQIDETLAEAHTSLGFVQWEYYWDWLEAEEELKRAIELNPRYAIGHLWYALFLMTMGRTEESLAEVKKAQALDPLSLIINACVGLMFFYARRYDQATEQLHETLRMDPNFGMAALALGWVDEQKSMYDEAITVLQKAANSLGLSFIGPMLGHGYTLLGDKNEARKLCDELNELSKQQYVSSFHTAAIYVALDEKDQAFKLLEKAYQERDGWLVTLKIDPRFDSIHSDRRFTELLKKMGLEK